MSFPSSKTVPTSGLSNPAMILRRVVFPHPEGPNKEKNSPLCISMLTSSSALKEPYARETSLTVTSKPFNLFPFPPSSYDVMPKTVNGRPCQSRSTIRSFARRCQYVRRPNAQPFFLHRPTVRTCKENPQPSELRGCFFNKAVN